MMSHQWKRTLALMAIAQACSIMGFSFVTPFLPLFIQQLGIHGNVSVTFWAALLSGGTAVFMAVAAPIWGVLADRHGRKIMVVRAMLSASVLIGLMSLAQSVYFLLALRMLQGMLTGTVSASQALVSAQAPRQRMGFTLGVMQTAVFVGTSLGPLVGGIVADAVGFRLSFVGGGAILLVGGLLVTFFVHEERVEVEHDAPRVGLWEGMRAAASAPALLVMVAAIFAVQFATTVVIPILPQFVQVLQGAAGHAATATGLIFMGAGAAGAISSVTLGYFSDRLGYRRILIAASIAAAILSVPQYFVTATWQLFVLRVLIGLALGAIMPSASALIATLVRPEQRGAAYGISGSATSIGFAVGPLTAAVVVSLSGLRAVFLTAAVMLLAIGMWVAFMVHIPEQPAEEPVPVSEEDRQETRIGA